MAFNEQVDDEARDNPQGQNATDDAPLSTIRHATPRQLPSVVQIAHRLNALNLGGTQASIESLTGRSHEGTSRGRRMLELSHECAQDESRDGDAA